MHPNTIIHQVLLKKKVCVLLLWETIGPAKKERKMREDDIDTFFCCRISNNTEENGKEEKEKEGKEREISKRFSVS